jgi:DNA transformation protein
MQPFRPHARQTLTSYYEVPVDILEDHAQLSIWAQQAVAAQRHAAAAKA